MSQGRPLRRAPKAARAPVVPKDECASVKLREPATIAPFIHVRTYKGSVTMTTPDAVIWMSADDAERLGAALIKIGRHRRRLDIAEKRYQKWADQ